MITVTYENRIAHIHLNAGVNKLSHAFTKELSQALLAAERAESIAVIIITTNENAFSVGAALDELIELSPDAVNSWLAPWETLSTLKKPVIVAVEGYALGGGLEIALMADILLASDTAQFGQPEIKLALIPGCGGTLRLTQAVGYHKAVEMCLTGEMIDAKRAFSMGLLNHVVPADKLHDKAMEIAKSIAKLSIPSLKALKKLIRSHYDASPSHTHALERERQVFIERLLTQDGREGLHAFMEKRDPIFRDR